MKYVMFDAASRKGIMQMLNENVVRRLTETGAAKYKPTGTKMALQ